MASLMYHVRVSVIWATHVHFLKKDLVLQQLVSDAKPMPPMPNTKNHVNATRCDAVPNFPSTKTPSLIPSSHHPPLTSPH